MKKQGREFVLAVEKAMKELNQNINFFQEEKKRTTKKRKISSISSEQFKIFIEEISIKYDISEKFIRTILK